MRPYKTSWKGKLPRPDLPALYTSSLVNLNMTLSEHIDSSSCSRIFPSNASRSRICPKRA
jgi:hypothetical protein